MFAFAKKWLNPPNYFITQTAAFNLIFTELISQLIMNTFFKFSSLIEFAHRPERTRLSFRQHNTIVKDIQVDFTL